MHGSPFPAVSSQSDHCLLSDLKAVTYVLFSIFSIQFSALLDRTGVSLLPLRRCRTPGKSSPSLSRNASSIIFHLIASLSRSLQRQHLMDTVPRRVPVIVQPSRSQIPSHAVLLFFIFSWCPVLSVLIFNTAPVKSP